MAVLFVPIWYQPLDDNGDIIPNGKVYTYAAGTVDTKKATYTDYTEAFQAANPVELDAAGRAVIWISGSYKFVVTDENDVEIKVIDNVTSYSIPDAAGNTYFQSFSGTGAQTSFTLSSDLGTDEKAVFVYVDAGAGKGYDIQNPNAFTLTSGGTPSIAFNVAPASGTNNIYIFAPLLFTNAASAAAAAAATSAASASDDATQTALDRIQTGLDRVATGNDVISTNAAVVLAQNYAAALTSTSTTSLAIAVASKSFTTQTGKQYAAGQFISAVSAANNANYMHGQVTSYNSGTGALVVNVTDIGGSGTLADWNISVSGSRGSTGPTGPAGSVSDGDKGDITVSSSGSVWTIDNLTVTAAKMNSGAATSGQVPIANGSGGVAYGDVSSGALVKLQTQTIGSAVANVDFVTNFTTTYKRYVIIMSNVTMSGSATLSLRFSTNNGTSFLNAANYFYNFTAFQSNTATLSSNFSESGTEGYFSNAQTNANHTINISGMAVASNPSYQVTGTSQSSTPHTTTVLSHGYYNSSITANAIRLFDSNANNFTAGTLTLYGVLQ